MRYRLVAVALASFAMSGCMARLVDFTALSTKNVNVPGDRLERVQGEDLATIILFFPTSQPNIKQAIDNAIQKSGGDLLVDGVIYRKCWYIPLLFGQCGFVVEGTPVKLPASNAPVNPSAGISR
jgi:hypothetical protein